ncbi:hypothetical protein ACFYOY_13705 [Streptomyces sp. NPDC007875]|uniref:DUF6197 family protein n=1 Tax=Streptomyces sp. NPDC007875 TaxID=3364783 RepID=UPI003697F026
MTAPVAPAVELRAVADYLQQRGWHPKNRSVIDLLSVDAWDALVTHMGEELVVPWERAPGRTTDDVVNTLRAAADTAEGGEAS